MEKKKSWPFVLQGQKCNVYKLSQPKFICIKIHTNLDHYSDQESTHLMGCSWESFPWYQYTLKELFGQCKASIITIFCWCPVVNIGHKFGQYINLHSILSYRLMDVLHTRNQNNLPRIKFSLWKAKSISHHLQTVKCHEDRFSGTVVVPRELLLHWNGNMRKRAKIIAGRLKNYHLYH